MTWRVKGKAVGIFLLIWLTGWTAGCCVLVGSLLTDFEWSKLLFSIPFLSAEVFVACLCLYILLGRQVLTISATQIELWLWVMRPLQRRAVPLDEVGIAVFSPLKVGADNATVAEPCVSISTLGRPLAFAQGVSADEGEWLAGIVNECLDRLAFKRAGLDIATNSAGEPGDDDQLDSTPEQDDSIEVTGPSFPALERPSDSAWQVYYEGRSLEFQRRGRWSAGAIALSTFLSCFWNGIVSVFIFELVRDFQWFLALFLVPFVVIGLVLGLVWVSAVLAPLSKKCYSIRLGSVVKRNSLLGLGRTKNWEFGELDQLRIVRRKLPEAQTSRESPFDISEMWDLEFVQRDANIVTTLERLTLGEARWMADMLWHHQPEMFRRRR